MYIILVYDIKFDKDGVGQKILPKVFKICKKYLYHIQNSVFEGELTKSEIFKLKKELEEVIRKDEDSIIVFQSRNERWLNKNFWGVVEDKTSNFL
ncbi:CRISPR-associated protein Cas2 [Marinitoga hydrogenitolerans DSM 16785]|uniref:CRISPR-associated endoribonuclease Cas2 n=1 Tax=Marinitoga hydrogenitolerans (strain DSM 16785 / JCM 12826 / AT1271) TaxID=1122195 RepID=A0A1M4Z4C7_MARH1|nr:CRISPR-associated endonuclease Cas2 [Marinitoga hydrogenitolerans]SHF12870.1 CRISPR-associated protein Cas2 [Marinitoga hydrogenitolerans DSM 16785]